MAVPDIMPNRLAHIRWNEQVWQCAQIMPVPAILPIHWPGTYTGNIHRPLLPYLESLILASPKK